MTRSIKVQIQVRLRETAKSGEIETADLALEFKVLRFLQIQLATHPHFTLHPPSAILLQVSSGLQPS